MTTNTDTDAPSVPVRVSSSAHADLIKHMRTWSDWDDARLRFGTPSVSPYAHTDMLDREFVVNIDALLLNPNRVLLKINPFRLRQEAVLTGALLHEAGHARHSRWLPSSPDDAPALHSDGTTPSKATIDLAVTVEEARIEGLMARDEVEVGARGLGWTMRACAAALLPPTHLDGDADQQLIDLIGSWIKRAGRQIALMHHVSGYALTAPRWPGEFTALVHNTVADHLMTVLPDSDDPGALSKADTVTMQTQTVMGTLRNMIKADEAHDTDSYLLDTAREVLEILFPETDPDDMPSPSDAGCGSIGDSQPNEGEDDEAEAGDGAEAGDEGEGEGEGASESADQGEGGGEAQSEDAEPGDGSGEGQGEASGEAGEGDEAGEGSGASPSTEADERAERMKKALTQTLAEIESTADQQCKDEAKAEIKNAPTTPDADPNIRGAGGGGGAIEGNWRRPTPDERQTARNASRFLRDLIDPTETSHVTLTDSPSAQVDAAAMAAWKAGGQRRDPRFFVRTRRDVMPAPPVKIAVLVDVSQSMGVLQKPSALMSWAVASAVVDLRNFAGNGQQVESCLVHWGNRARVIQPNGGTLPGLREVACSEGTHAMAAAMDLVEAEMPGFFDPSEKPENRLLVQFTDWDLFGSGSVVPRMTRAMRAGVNMLTIAPAGYWQRSDLPGIMSQVQRAEPGATGRSVEVVYNKMFPEAVWDEAAKVLSQR